jgi:hypothetical protein
MILGERDGPLVEFNQRGRAPFGNSHASHGALPTERVENVIPYG